MAKANRPFVPPQDIKAWWSPPHCGPGRKGPAHDCGFCGEPVLECARKHSDNVAAHPDWVHDGGICDDGQDDPEGQMTCGGSGFWCSGCGRFWANDSCGESFGAEHAAADEAKLESRDGRVYCPCGKQLMKERTDA